MYELKSFIAIYLLLVITTSFLRFNQNEIDILDPRQKCNRLMFLLFQNDDLTKNSFLQFLMKKQHLFFFFGKIHNYIAIEKFSLNMSFFQK